MGKRKRLKNNKQRSMRRRLVNGKKPMSPEAKLAQKNLKENQIQRQDKTNAKTSKTSKVK